MATIQPVSTSDLPTDGREPIHQFFGLSYSNYLVLHRTLMQSMPADWQRRAVAVFNELHEAYQHIEHPEAFIVTAAKECTYSDLSEADMRTLGVTLSDASDGDGEDADLPDVFYDRDGNEHEIYDPVLVPAADPVPHYNRGRTRVAPQLPGGR